MKTENQSSTELDQLCKLIKDMPVAMLTSIDAEGALVSRPMSPLEMDGKGALWFFTDRHSTKLAQLAAVNLSFIDAEHSTYVSLAGYGELATDRAHIDRLWTPLLRPWFPDGPESDSIALLKVVPVSAEYWDAPSSKMVRMFAMAASVAAARPIAMGDHDTFTGLDQPQSKVV